MSQVGRPCCCPSTQLGSPTRSLRSLHALTPSLFATLFFALFGIFHAWLSHKLFIFCFFAAGVMFGVVAGMFQMTPFGHGLQCGNPVESFPEKYRPFVNECSRITAISALAWTMFALSTIGFFWSLFDAFKCTTRNTQIYTPYVKPEKPKDVEAEGETDTHNW